MKGCYDSCAVKRKKREHAVNGPSSLSKKIVWCIYTCKS